MTNNTIQNSILKSDFNRPEVENWLHILDMIFTMTEVTIRRNPWISWDKLDMELVTFFDNQNLHLSSSHRNIIKKIVREYEISLQTQLEILRKWFSIQGKVLPDNLWDIEKVINSDKSINFHAWMVHLEQFNDLEIGNLLLDVIFHGWISDIMGLYHQAASPELKKLYEILFDNYSWDELLAKIDDNTLKLNFIGCADVFMTFDYWEKMRLFMDIHYITWWVCVSLTYRPIAIELYYPDRIFQTKWVAWYYIKNTGITKMRDKWRKFNFELNEIAEHEYQHLIRDRIFKPVQLDLAGSNWSWESRYISGIDHRILTDVSKLAISHLWDSVQDELCSYLWRNKTLLMEIAPYLTSIQGQFLENWDIEPEKIAWIQKILVLIDFLLFQGVETWKIVSIIRTSWGFDIAIERLVVNFAKFIPPGFITSMDMLIDNIAVQWFNEKVDDIITIGTLSLQLIKDSENDTMVLGGHLLNNEIEFFGGISKNSIFALKEVLLLLNWAMNPFKNQKDAQHLFSKTSIGFRTKKYSITTAIKEEGIVALVHDRIDVKKDWSFPISEFVVNFRKLSS